MLFLGVRVLVETRARCCMFTLALQYRVSSYATCALLEIARLLVIDGGDAHAHNVLGQTPD